MPAPSDWLTPWARFQPDAEALFDVGTGRRWTWAELDRGARRWAGWLATCGVEAGDRVAVLAKNRGETIELLFAAAHLGAVLFPMNWRLSPAELRWQLDDCGPRVLLTDTEHQALALGDWPRSTFEAAAASEPEHRVSGRCANTFDDPWQLMYTSGSTGRPKGALLTHRQALFNAIDTTLACDLDRTSSTLTFAPLFHTGGMNCLTTPLLHRGGRVVLVPSLDAAEALALIEAEGVTHLMGVPTIYQMLADHPTFATTDLSGVRDALCGGAPLSVQLMERYQARGIPLRQGFGLTEVGPNCFSMPADQARARMQEQPDNPTAGPPGSCVGRPIHHLDAKVVRADGSACSPGEPGELLLRGPAVCAGYWGRPDATAASIIDGWFHTGDILSVDQDGFFYVRGRLKEMFISGGENVYPAEVESALQACPGVALAAVVGVPDERWGEVGRAFVETAPGAALDPASLRGFLDGRLARYKVPKHFTLTPALPRTGSGKLDKAALAALPL
jgi:fatty-acyl-CoA synthase